MGLPVCLWYFLLVLTKHSWLEFHGQSAGCLQLMELLEISWKLLLEILEISWNLVDAPGNFIISRVISARLAIFSALYCTVVLG